MLAVVFTGTVSIGSILTLATTALGVLGIYLQQRGTKEHVARVDTKVEEINRAVNGVGPDKRPLVQNVQEIHDQLTSRDAQAAFDANTATVVAPGGKPVDSTHSGKPITGG